jgi:hypothetical protein
MINLNSLIVQYRSAWKKLWRTDPPIVRKHGNDSVIIVSEHGENKLSAFDFEGRIIDMRHWAEQARAA